MIPGNTPEDHEWEALYEWLEHYAAKEGLTPYEIRRMIEMPTGDKDDHSTNDE